jgi:hypothetical protein
VSSPSSSSTRTTTGSPAANTVPGQIGDWTKVSGRTDVKQDQRIPLDTAGTEFRYYLLWIVELPEDNKAEVQELSLLR